jgi:hypothetical protein
MKHVSEPPPPVRGRRGDVPSGMVYAIERALAKRPDDRWRSAAEFRDAIMDRSAHRAHVTDAEPHLGHARVVPVPPPPTAQRTFPPGYPEPAMREAQRRLVPVPPSLEDPPEGLTRAEREKWYRTRGIAQRGGRRIDAPIESPDEKIIAKIAKFRRSFLGYIGITFMLFVINAMAGGDVWFIFPALGMMIALLFQLGTLWGDGVKLRDVFFGPVRRNASDLRHVAHAEVVRDAASSLAAREILDGPHGQTVRRAVASQRVVVDLLQRMTPKEREMLPKDLEATVKALVDRVVSLSTTLHRLDVDANGGSLGSLDTRIENLKREPETPERERRLALLERQRVTLRDLIERRTALMAQLESASLALETLKLDLVRFRSAGVASALEDVTSATREARAVSRDIGHMLEAQDELRRL